MKPKAVLRPAAASPGTRSARAVVTAVAATAQPWGVAMRHSGGSLHPAPEPAARGPRSGVPVAAARSQIQASAGRRTDRPRPPRAWRRLPGVRALRPLQRGAGPRPHPTSRPEIARAPLETHSFKYVDLDCGA